jgi:hypothetical protein
MSSQVFLRIKPFTFLQKENTAKIEILYFFNSFGRNFSLYIYKVLFLFYPGFYFFDIFSRQPQDSFQPVNFLKMKFVCFILKGGKENGLAGNTPSEDIAMSVKDRPSSGENIDFILILINNSCFQAGMLDYLKLNQAEYNDSEPE